MKIFTAINPKGFEFAHPENPDDFEVFASLDCTSRRQSWEPVRMRLITRDDEGRPLEGSDAPWLGSWALILKPKTSQKLSPLLDEYGELLPLVCVNADLSVFNPMRCIDALDEAASSILRFPDGRIMHIQRYVFRPEAIQGIDVFKLPRLKACPNFVSERFVHAWRAANLQGLEFIPVWPDAGASSHQD